MHNADMQFTTFPQVCRKVGPYIPRYCKCTWRDGIALVW